MSIVTTQITFSGKGDEIKRLMKKNDKERLSRTVVNIHHITNDDSLSEEEKLKKIKDLTLRSYW